MDKTDLTEKDHEETVDSLREAPSCFRLAVARADKAAATAAAAAGEIPSEAPEKEAVRVKSPVKAWEEQREVTLTKEAHGRLGFSILDYEVSLPSFLWLSLNTDVVYCNSRFWTLPRVFEMVCGDSP